MKQIKTIAVAAFAVASVVFMSFTASSISKEIIAADNAVKISWAKDSHDFGEIPKGKPVSVEFTFTNTGDEPLLIAEVATSCGCTASDYPKAPIAPGKSSQVKATFNAGTAGAFAKTITVNFQDPTIKKVLTIKGIVK
jgi:hypothetical protein